MTRLLLTALKTNILKLLKIIIFYISLYCFQIFQINFSFYQSIINHSSEILILVFFLSSIWVLTLFFYKNKFFLSNAVFIQWVSFLIVFFLYKENVLFGVLKLNAQNFYSKFYISSELVQGPALYHGVLFVCTSVSYIKWVDFTSTQSVKSNKATIKQQNSYLKVSVFMGAFVYSFAFGAYWAFFSDVWGYWFNWDPIELFLLILIIFSGVKYHLKYNKKCIQFLKITNIFAFYTIFLWCLRLGFLNSRHSSSFEIDSNIKIYCLLYVYITAAAWYFLFVKIWRYKQKNNLALRTAYNLKKNKKKIV